MICLDSTFLGLVFNVGSNAPNDPITGLPIPRLDERIEDQIERWQKKSEKVIIPTPVLSEFLVIAAEQGSSYLEDIENATHFIVRPFDQKAAIELAAIYIKERSTMSKGAKKRDSDTKAKLRFDRQIVAIAKANGAKTIYSDDNGVETFATQHGIKVVKTWQLPAPTPKAVELPFPDPEEPKPLVKIKAANQGKVLRIADAKRTASNETIQTKK